MKLFEYEVKSLFRQYGIPVPLWHLVRNPKDATDVFRTMGGDIVLKSQVLSGGRGKAGAIRFCSTVDQVFQVSSQLLGSSILGKKVECLLIEEKIKPKEEYYMGITFDPRAGLPVLLMSRKGGVDIEEIPPCLVFSETINPLEGLPQFKARHVAKKASFPAKLYMPLGQIASQLYKLFVDKDAIVIEINPLVLTENEDLIAVDGKMDIDDDALIRHPEWEKRTFDGTDLEVKARQRGLHFVELDGDVGICGNGAGMMMTAMDLIVRHGGRPANFCEAGGAHARAGSGRGAIEWWRDATILVLSNPRVTRFLFNLVGGNQRGDEVAMGIVEALKDKDIPVAIRLSGTRQEEGRRILAEHGYKYYDTLEEAVQAIVRLGG